MATVAMVYNPVPEARDRRAAPRRPGRRGSTPATWPAWTAWRRWASRCGGRRPRWGWTGPSAGSRCRDGGAGLEDWLRTNFGRVEAVILDFYHAAEYLGDLARALHPGDEAAASRWLGAWCHRLKHEGGRRCWRACGPWRSAAARRGEARAEVVRYFENQAHRMDYPSYVAKGWPIGSGPVESACKTVIGQRMKGSGMSWGRDGADAVCHLRALFKSGDDRDRQGQGKSATREGSSAPERSRSRPYLPKSPTRRFA